MDDDSDLRVWQRLAPAGLLLVGLGTCVTADAATRKARQGRLGAWTVEGTTGLVLLNAGLSLFGEAVKRRALHDTRVARRRLSGRRRRR